MLKKVAVKKAIGLKLAHDLTRIVPGRFKGVGFPKGHVIRPEDIPKFLDLGKKHVFVLRLRPGELHENQAAKRISRAAAGRGVLSREPKEGKVDFLSGASGLLKVNIPALQAINSVGGVILSVRHTCSVVKAGEVLGGTRAIPLTIPEKKKITIERICRRKIPVLQVLPFRKKKVGILVTGSEIFEGRIRDRSAGIVKKKVEALGSRVISQAMVPDNATQIAWEIRKMKSAGCQLIIATGGLSVDPDDVTLEGIRRSGAKVTFYGVPVLPGSMSLMARLGNTFILGAPACVVHDPITALDLFLPRFLADDPITRKEVIRLGHGGLCLKCGICHFPICPFGRGE